jgi:hypothetical protein
MAVIAFGGLELVWLVPAVVWLQNPVIGFAA